MQETNLLWRTRVNSAQQCVYNWQFQQWQFLQFLLCYLVLPKAILAEIIFYSVYKTVWFSYVVHGTCLKKKSSMHGIGQCLRHPFDWTRLKRKAILLITEFNVIIHSPRKQCVRMVYQVGKVFAFDWPKQIAIIISRVYFFRVLFLHISSSI